MKTYTATLFDCQVKDADKREAEAKFCQAIEADLGGENEVAEAYDEYERVFAIYEQTPLPESSSASEKKTIARWNNAESIGCHAAFAGWHSWPDAAHFEIHTSKVYEEITIPRDGEKDIRFTGELVCESKTSPNNASSYYSGSTGRWMVFKLYKTKTGKFVCQSIGRTQWQGEKDRYKGAVCTTESGVIEFFGHSDLAKDIYTSAGIDDAETVE